MQQSGFDIIKVNGCPSLDDYDDPALDSASLMHLYWMHGHDKYYRGMHNKIDSTAFIHWDSTLNSLELLKHWIADHNNGDETGGLAEILIYAGYGWQYSSMFPYGTPEFGKHYVTQWSDTLSHALTIVGYHDSVHCFDLNNDSIYSNNDLDSNGIIELSECELGAFLAVNSWPPDQFADEGYVYIPYRLMDDGFSNPDKALVCYANADYEPQLTINTSITHPARKLIYLSAGYAENADSMNYTDYKNFGIFKHQGDTNWFRGAYEGPMELGLDFSHHYSNVDFGKIFYRVWTNDFYNTFTGFVDTFSIVDYRWDEEFHLGCESEFPYQIIKQNPGVFIDFTVDYDLIPHEDPIVSDLLLFSNMVSRFNPTVSNNAVLTIEDSVEIDMYNSCIEIEAGASLIIGDNVIFTGKTGQNELIINGNVQFGENVQFININNILLNNENIQTSINNGYFYESILLNKGKSLTMNKCSFYNCEVLWSTQGNISVDSCQFYCTWLLLDNLFGSQNNVSTISNSYFVGESDCPAGLFLSDYNMFQIESNTFNDCGSGIQIWESGQGISGNQNVFGNEVKNCSNKGINIYNSRVSLAENNIHDNEFGVWSARNSQLAIVGNAAAYTNSETHQILDNNSYELYASEYSFPWYFKYCVVIDENNSGNPNDPLVYWETQGTDKMDIRYNCWGQNFSATEDLYPVNGYFWSPVWCPPGTTLQNSTVEQLYLDANDEFEGENFSQAQLEYQYIIDQYPNTRYAEAAMKDLYSIEKFVDNDYAALKNYFDNSDSIQANIRLKKLASHLTNKCNVELENWQLAIDHFEDIIENPDTPADSIFAIIDLGYTYLLMEGSGTKSFYAGKMLEYIPQSNWQYFDSREYLLSLLPFQKDNAIPSSEFLKNTRGLIQQNIPNPFTGKTKVIYDTYKAGYISLKIYNHLGTEILVQRMGFLDPGTHEGILDLSGLPEGVYYCTLLINDSRVASHKMILIK